MSQVSLVSSPQYEGWRPDKLVAPPANCLCKPNRKVSTAEGYQKLFLGGRYEEDLTFERLNHNETNINIHTFVSGMEETKEEQAEIGIGPVAGPGLLLVLEVLVPVG